MQYIVLYDVLEVSYPSWPSLLIGTAILLICFAMLLPATWMPNDKLRSLHMRAQPYLPRKVIAIAFVFGAIFTSGAIWNYVRWHEVQEMARSGELSVIEGPLTEVHSWSTQKSQRESLAVGGARFQYSDSDAVSPFPLLRGTNALAKGQRVRITHVGDTLVKVEGPLCHSFERCEVTTVLGVRTEVKR